MCAVYIGVTFFFFRNNISVVQIHVRTLHYVTLLQGWATVELSID